MQFDRVWLGTVQFGLPYGLAKRRLSANECLRQMDAAWEAGIRSFDTARVYGESEHRIGSWIAVRGRVPKVASKLEALEDVPDEDVPKAFATSLETTRRNLGLDKIDIFLCHRAVDFLRPPVQECLERARDDGLIGAYGVSCYNPQDALGCLAVKEDIALVQVPASIVDRRVMNSTLPAVASENGTTLQLRSLYLQGALLMKPEDLPDRVRGLAPFVELFRTKARRARLSSAALAVAYVTHRISKSHVVIGFRSVAQIEALKKVPDEMDQLSVLFSEIDEGLAAVPPALLDPRNWS